jgi:hypothetical protein
MATSSTSNVWFDRAKKTVEQDGVQYRMVFFGGVKIQNLRKQFIS